MQFGAKIGRHETESFKAGKCGFQVRKVGVSWQETVEGEIVPKWGEIEVEFMCEYYLHYLTKIIGKMFGGFRKKLYLCTVNQGR